jgi:hypothetical protein
LKNSSIAVITGPFAFWTTARSAETFSGGAFGDAGSSFPFFPSACLLSVFVSEQPARKAAAEASAAAREKPRRVVVVVSFFGSDVEQVPQPEVLQVPQPLAAALITWSWSAIDNPFDRTPPILKKKDSGSRCKGLLFTPLKKAVSLAMAPFQNIARIPSK